MTPAEIAKKLTPKQREILLRFKSGKQITRQAARVSAKVMTDMTIDGFLSVGRITDLGLAVLAELDKGETNGSR